MSMAPFDQLERRDRRCGGIDLVTALLPASGFRGDQVFASGDRGAQLLVFNQEHALGYENWYWLGVAAALSNT